MGCAGEVGVCVCVYGWKCVLKGCFMDRGVTAKCFGCGQSVYNGLNIDNTH